MTAQKKRSVSKTAQSRSARLLAVQTLYGVLHTGNDMKEAVADTLVQAEHMEIDGEELVPPNKILFQKILYGYVERKGDVEDIIAGSLTTKKMGETETLLHAILCCGVYELLAHNDIDAPIIINDYLDVAHGFYESGQVKLINGVLDKAAKALRA